MGGESRPEPIDAGEDDFFDFDLDELEGDDSLARKFQWDERDFASEDVRVKRVSLKTTTTLQGSKNE